MYYDEESIIKILIKRDGMLEEEALDTIKEARLRIADGEDPEEVLYEVLGLEPDYVWALL